MRFITELLSGNKNPTEEQKTLHTGEVFVMWHHLVMRYDVYELTSIFHNYAKDTDFKLITNMGLEILDEEIITLENEMIKRGINMPTRPPKAHNTSSNAEIFRDEFMFRIIYMGIQNFLTQHIRDILAVQNPELRTMFQKLEQLEMSFYTKLTDYGMLKGWLLIPPEYSTQKN